MFSRAAAIIAPGRFLSQPAIVTRPSKYSPWETSSIESAISSRLTSDAFIPSVPIEIPSLTVRTPNSNGVPAADFTPALTRSASLSRCTLHGVMSDAVFATPMNGCSNSLSPTPTALSIARAAARSAPSATILLRCLTSNFAAVVICFSS